MDTTKKLETVVAPVTTTTTASEQSKAIAMDRVRTKLRAGAKSVQDQECW